MLSLIAFLLWVWRIGHCGVGKQLAEDVKSVSEQVESPDLISPGAPSPCDSQMFIQEGPRDGKLYGKGALGVPCLETVCAWQIQWVVLGGNR